jgi:hypothetical protein
VDFKILDSQYSKDKVKGQIKNIVFRNIDVVGDFFPPSLLLGYDGSHGIANIVFDDFRVHGKKIVGVGDLKATLQFAKDISFK